MAGSFLLARASKLPQHSIADGNARSCPHGKIPEAAELPQKKRRARLPPEGHPEDTCTIKSPIQQKTRPWLPGRFCDFFGLSPSYEQVSFVAARPLFLLEEVERAASSAVSSALPNSSMGRSGISSAIESAGSFEAVPAGMSRPMMTFP